MTAPEFHATLDRLGLTQAGAAALLGVHRVTVAHWSRGARPIPKIVQNFLVYVEAHPAP